MVELIDKIAPYVFLGLIWFILGVRLIARYRKIPKKILTFLSYL